MVNECEPQPTNKVMLFGATDSVPSEVRAIGQLTVDGKSVSLKEQYSRALSLAVTEAARKGGNVLVVNNNELNKNRLKGTIAFMDGETDDVLTLSPKRALQLQNSIAVKSNVTIAKMDTVQQQEMMRRQEDALLQRNVPLDELQSVSNNLEIEQVNTKKKQEGQSGMIKVSAGPVWTTSKIYLTSDASQYLSNQRGTGLSLSLTSASKNAYCFGADLFVNYTEINIDKYTKSSYTLMYLGPCALMGGNITDKLRLDASIGLGLAYYQDDGQTELGFGMRSSLGLEYMISKKTGIGIDLIRQVSRFKRPEGFNQPNDEAYGYDNVGLMVTVRLHM